MRTQFKRSMLPRRRRRSSGTELLELGLVLGLILLPLMFGTIEFGTYFYVEHNLQAAAREGARAGCVVDAGQRESAVQDAIARVLDGSRLGQNNLQPDIGWNIEADANNTNYIVVTVSTTWDKIPEGLRPMLMIRHPEKAVIEGRAAFRLETENNQ